MKVASSFFLHLHIHAILTCTINNIVVCGLHLWLYVFEVPVLG